MRTGIKAALVVLILAGTIAAVTIMNRAPAASGELVSEVSHTAYPVHAITLSQTTAVERLRRTGVLRADKDVTISPEVGGRVRRVLKELGDACAKGEIIVQLDEEGYGIGAAQAKAAVKQAEVALDQATRTMTRMDRLKESAVATDQEWDSARGGVDASGAALEQARAAHRLALRNLRETAVRCPFDGRVAERLAEVGQSVAPGTPLARIVASETLRLTINVSGAQLSRLLIGQRVELRDPADPSRALPAAISRLGVAADPQTRTFPVEISADGGSGVMRPGQVVEALCELAVHEGALMIPTSAVAKDGDRAFVVLVVDGAAKRVEVALGPQIDDAVMALGGVKQGDRVIVVGKDALADGARVSVVDGAE